MNQQKVSISHGNRKMGEIPSVSLPACVTCNPDAPCFKECYAAKIERIYKTAAAAYNRNLDILNNDWDSYWGQVRNAVSMARFFRFHVSGDIPNAAYFKEMVITARKYPNTSILAFTKQFDIVNHYIDVFGPLPNNLKVIFSNWGAWKCNNPHGLPVCEVIFKGNKPADQWKICGGNCTECACAGIGCWELKNNETIAIYKH